ncbi:hypothetical protein G9P44_000283 [Scheffersomyces stipitis]|nr:hypothetical protein G9P44_000283 [Scheffersomyces stipitis]
MADANDIEDQVRLFRPVFQESASGNQLHTSNSTTQLRYHTHPGPDTIYASITESSSLLGRFPYSLVMKVSTSEPRDVLQSERTTLTFIRFATSLFFTALGIILNFKLNSSGVDSDDPGSGSPEHRHGHFNVSTYSTIVSYILLILALATLVISGINYFITIQRYANHKIQVYSFNNITTVICVTCIIITLMVISISLIVQGYLEES